MNWNYRVIRRNVGGATVFGIHEVHYSSNRDILGWTENPVIPTGETIDELKKDFSMQLQALELPVLDHDELERKSREEG